MAAWSVGAGIAAAENRTTVLVKAGDPVPALGAGFTWQAIHVGIADHTINDQGFVAFSGVIAGPGVDSTNANVLMAGRIGGPYRVVVRAGQAAPGAAAGVVFNIAVLPFLTESGRVLFYGVMTGPGVTTANDGGFWLESDPPGGAPLPVLLEGGPAPGYPGLTIASVDARGVSFQPRYGLLATPAVLAGPGVTTTNSSVLYQSTVAVPGTLTPLGRAGDLIPGAVGVSYGTFGAGVFAGGPESTEVLARNALVGGAITSADDGSILRYYGAPGPGVVIREGSQIPGRPAGQVYNVMLSPYAMPTGDIAYFATVTGGGVSTPNGATWVGSRLGASGGDPRPLAIRDTPAPGFPAGSIMTTGVIDRFDVAANGRAVYGSTCSGTGVTTANDTALFSEAVGGVGVPAMLMREGDVPPGLSAPSAYGALGAIYNSCTINARNQVAFFAYAPGVGAADVVSDTGLWVVNASGAVQLVAHRTRPFQLSPTDARTPIAAGFRVISGPQRPGRRWFLDDGRLITSMSFSDSSSALVLLHVDPPCRADFNNDGMGATLQDLFDFLAAWFNQSPSADINGIDGVTVQDLFDFLFLWFAGCA